MLASISSGPPTATVSGENDFDRAELANFSERFDPSAGIVHVGHVVLRLGVHQISGDERFFRRQIKRGGVDGFDHEEIDELNVVAFQMTGYRRTSGCGIGNRLAGNSPRYISCQWTTLARYSRMASITGGRA